eukprot:3550458-Rhodomonas_salina.1
MQCPVALPCLAMHALGDVRHAATDLHQPHALRTVRGVLCKPMVLRFLCKRKQNKVSEHPEIKKSKNPPCLRTTCARNADPGV